MKAPSLFLLLSAGLAVGQVVPLNRAQLRSDMDANAKRITNAPAPIAAGDLVNKAYVDSGTNLADASVSWPKLDTNLQALVQQGTNLPADSTTGALTNNESRNVTLNNGLKIAGGNLELSIGTIWGSNGVYAGGAGLWLDGSWRTTWPAGASVSEIQAIMSTSTVQRAGSATYADSKAPEFGAGFAYTTPATNQQYESWPTLRRGPGNLIYKTRGEGPTHANSTNTALALLKSSDGGQTWTRTVVATNAAGECRNHTFGVTSQGRLIIINNYVIGGSYLTNAVWYSDDEGATWESSTAIPRNAARDFNVPFGPIQEVGDRLISTIYTGDNDGSDGRVDLLWSDDQGLTWQTNFAIFTNSALFPTETTLCAFSPSAWMALVRLDDASAVYPYRQCITTNRGTNWFDAGYAVFREPQDPGPPCITSYSTPEGVRAVAWIGNRARTLPEVYSVLLEDVWLNPTNWRTASYTELGAAGSLGGVGVGGYVTAVQTDTSGKHLVAYYKDEDPSGVVGPAVVWLTNFIPPSVTRKLEINAPLNSTARGAYFRITGTTNELPFVSSIGGVADGRYGEVYYNTNEAFAIIPGFYSLVSGGTYLEQVTRSDAEANGYTAVYTAFTGDTSPGNPPFRFQAYKLASGNGTAIPLSTNDPVFGVFAGSSNAFSVDASGNAAFSGGVTATGALSGATLAVSGDTSISGNLTAPGTSNNIGGVTLGNGRVTAATFSGVGSGLVFPVGTNDGITSSVSIGGGGVNTTTNAPHADGDGLWTDGSYNGLYNTFVGDYSVGASNRSGYGNTFMGYGAGRYTTYGPQNTFIGWLAGYLNRTNFHNTYVGVGAGQQNQGDYNTFVGCDSALVRSNTHYSTIIGSSAGGYAGNYSTIIGFYAGPVNTANDVTFIGAGAGNHNTTGINTGIGKDSLYSVTSGSLNLAASLNSLRSLVTGIGNVGLGYAALYTNVAGHYNVGVGYQPLFYYTNGSSIGIGYQAGISVHGGTGNVFLGNAADGGAWYLENAMALGENATVTNSNEVVLGNPSVKSTILRGNVTGPTNMTLRGNLSVSNNTTIGGTFSVSGNLTALGASNNLNGVIVTNGGVHVPGTLRVTGAQTNADVIAATAFFGSGAGLTDLPDAFDTNSPVAYATTSGSVTGVVTEATHAVSANYATNAASANMAFNANSAVSATVATHATNFWGQLSPTNFNAGTGAGTSTFLRGDGTWASAGSGEATNVLQIGTTNGSGIHIGTNDLDRLVFLDTAKPMAYAATAGSATNNTAESITSGTLADARLSANVPRLNAANAFTASNTFSLAIWAAKIASGAEVSAQRLILSSPNYAGLQLNALTSTERDGLENEAAGHVFWNSTLSKIQVATAGETFETVLTEENYTPPATPDILAVLTAGSDADGEDLTGLTTLEATSGIFGNIYGDASGASNALAIIAGENVTVTTNAGGRSFTVAAASSGSATNIMRTTVQAPLSIATNDLLYTISFDANAPVAYATTAGSVTGTVNVATAATYSGLATNATLTNAVATLGNVNAAAFNGDGSGISNVTATVSAGPFSETIAEANACGVTTNTWTTTNLIKLDGCASLFVADLDDITDGSSIVGLGNNLRFGLVQEGGVAGAVFGIGDQAGNSALWVRDGFWFAGLGNDITNAAGFHFADTNFVTTNLATKITTNAALDALSINNAAALTNLSPAKLTWFDLATLAGTNNIAGFWIIGTNNGIRYSIPVVTNTP